MKTQLPEAMRYNKGSAKGKVYSIECLPTLKATEGLQISDRMLHLKHLEKQEQAKVKTSRRGLIKK
jgi:hypothetical protein